MRSIVTNEDCMVGMARYPDKWFELAIVDPPYGLGTRTTDGGGSNSQIKFMKDIRRSDWDKSAPSQEYFKELCRISRNQIIWGGNYFALPPTRTIIAWEKMVAIPTMSQIEIAWTSFDSPARLVKINNTDALRFHPTQKPVALYTWLLKNYAKQGDKILDTHGGSMSSVIAAIKGGFDITCFEIDKDYYEKAKERIENFISQENMFAEKPTINFIDTRSSTQISSTLCN